MSLDIVNKVVAALYQAATLLAQFIGLNVFQVLQKLALVNAVSFFEVGARVRLWGTLFIRWNMGASKLTAGLSIGGLGLIQDLAIALLPVVQEQFTLAAVCDVAKSLTILLVDVVHTIDD